MAQRVLVVDDYIDNARTLALLVNKLGHTATYAINAWAALQIAADFRPQIAFLDMVLPDVDGADLSLLLRQRVAPDALQVFAVSGFDSAEVRDRAARAGCNEFLLKPLGAASIKRLLG